SPSNSHFRIHGTTAIEGRPRTFHILAPFRAVSSRFRAMQPSRRRRLTRRWLRPEPEGQSRKPSDSCLTHAYNRMTPALANLTVTGHTSVDRPGVAGLGDGLGKE